MYPSAVSTAVAGVQARPHRLADRVAADVPGTHADRWEFVTTLQFDRRNVSHVR